MVHITFHTRHSTVVMCVNHSHLQHTTPMMLRRWHFSHVEDGISLLFVVHTVHLRCVRWFAWHTRCANATFLVRLFTCHTRCGTATFLVCMNMHTHPCVLIGDIASTHLFGGDCTLVNVCSARPIFALAIQYDAANSSSHPFRTRTKSSQVHIYDV